MQLSTHTDKLNIAKEGLKSINKYESRNKNTNSKRGQSEKY